MSSKRNQSGAGLVASVGCLGFLLWAAIWAAIIFVAVHFIGKFW